MNQKEVISLVLEERQRQNAKWGIQHHHPIEWLNILGEEVGEANQAACDIYFNSDDTMSPRGSTYNKQKYDHYIIEMVQTCAVALSALEDILSDK